MCKLSFKIFNVSVSEWMHRTYDKRNVCSHCKFNSLYSINKQES